MRTPEPDVVLVAAAPSHPARINIATAIRPAMNLIEMNIGPLLQIKNLAKIGFLINLISADLPLQV
jgi:hypothetical protein